MPLVHSIQMTSFNMLKLSMTVRFRGHKQRKLNDMFIHSFFVSCVPHYQAELKYIVSGLLYKQDANVVDFDPYCMKSVLNPAQTLLV